MDSLQTAIHKFSKLIEKNSANDYFTNQYEIGMNGENWWGTSYIALRATPPEGLEHKNCTVLNGNPSGTPATLNPHWINVERPYHDSPLLKRFAVDTEGGTKWVQCKFLYPFMTGMRLRTGFTLHYVGGAILVRHNGVNLAVMMPHSAHVSPPTL